MNEKQTGGSRIKKSPGAAGKEIPMHGADKQGADAGNERRPVISASPGKGAAKNPPPGKNNIRINTGVNTGEKKYTKNLTAPEPNKSSPKPAPEITRSSAKPGNAVNAAKAKPRHEEKPAEPAHRAVHTDINEVRRNEHSIRVLKRIMAALIIVLIGLIVYITYPHWIASLEGIFDRPVHTEFNDGMTEKGNFPLEPDNTVTGVYTVKNDLVTTDPHTITFYDINGERLASYNHNFSKPIVRTAGKRVLVFDNGAYDFKLYKKGGESYSKTTDETILTGAVCEEGTAVIVTTSNKYAASAKFYDKDGKLIYNYDCTARIMAVTLNPEGTSCYICTFYSGNGELHSQVRRIDLDKKGEQMISEEIPSLAIGCRVNDAGDIMVVSDTDFYILSPDGKLRSEYNYDGDLISYDLGHAGASVLLSGGSKNTGMLMIAKAGATGSSEFRELTLDSAVKLVKTTNDRVILLSSDKAFAFDFMGNMTATAAIGREYSNFTYIEQALYLLGKHGVDKIKFTM